MTFKVSSTLEFYYKPNPLPTPNASLINFPKKTFQHGDFEKQSSKLKELWGYQGNTNLRLHPKSLTKDFCNSTPHLCHRNNLQTGLRVFSCHTKLPGLLPHSPKEVLNPMLDVSSAREAFLYRLLQQTPRMNKYHHIDSFVQPTLKISKQ